MGGPHCGKFHARDLHELLQRKKAEAPRSQRADADGIQT
jgi:hypothetical protein